MLAGDRQVRERPHVVRLGVDDQPPLLEAEVPARDPARLAHERVGAVGAHDPPRADGPRLAGQSEPSRLLFGDPPKRELNPVVGLDESLGGPSALDGHSRRDARMAVDRSLELRLEEHVIALPPGRRRTPRLEPQKQLPVGAEPTVVINRNHLSGQKLRQPERLQQPHDLVIDVNRARETIRLPETLERRDSVTSAPEKGREGLPDRAVTDDRDVEIRRVGFVESHVNLHSGEDTS